VVLSLVSSQMMVASCKKDIQDAMCGSHLVHNASIGLETLDSY
jgi:hypothetical protein